MTQNLPSGTVTFLLTDVEGSTAMLQRLGDRYPQVLEAHRSLLRDRFAVHGGAEIHAEGDGFFVAFARAIDAVRCAVEIQRDLTNQSHDSGESVRVRIGLHTGQPLLAEGDYVGIDVHRAARIGEAAHGGQVILSRATCNLVVRDLPPDVLLTDLGEQRLRGLDQSEQLFQLVIPGLPDNFPPLRTIEALPSNLPSQLTNFVGRRAELNRSVEACLQSRLLTLTGPGGTGKTRFALQLAEELFKHFPDGIYFVPLAPVFDSQLVLRTVAQTLGVSELPGRPVIESLKDFLRHKRMLLVLDNFEQVVDAGISLTELLQSSANLTIVVTSRVALRVTGEHEFHVPPLGLPPDQSEAEGIAWSGLAEYDAIQLFVERARAVQQDFRLSDENARDVAMICQQLDGLPLAIELAAARIRLLPPSAMLARLNRASTPDIQMPASEARTIKGESPGVRLQFLTSGARDVPERQRTLRSTIAWSYDLLTPNEQALFRRLAVFVGGFNVQAAEAACETPDVGDRRWAISSDDTLDGVESLIAKNLIRQASQSTAEPRFTMLETIREFGLERLAELGELRSMRRWHVSYYQALAEGAEPGMRGPDQVTWLDRLQTEHDNFRAALEWSLAYDGEGESALALSGALTWFWTSRASASEGRRWIEQALSASTQPSPARLRALYGLGWLTHTQRDSAAARQALTTALELARAQGNRWAEAWSLHVLGRVAYFDGDALQAREYADRCIAVASEPGVPESEWLIGWAIRLRGLSAHISADFQTAIDLYEEASEVHRRVGYLEGVGVNLGLIGMALHGLGDPLRAERYAQDSLRILHAAGSTWLTNSILAYVASIAISLGYEEIGVRIAGVSQVVSETIVASPIPIAEASLSAALESARRKLGPAKYLEALSAGRAMSLTQGVSLALELEGGNVAGQSDSQPLVAAGLAQLSERELQVLRMVASGQTNREIAEALVISIPTVERHITHVYSKIGVRGRAEATAFALRHNVLPE